MASDQRESEKRIFDAFLQLSPEFCGELLAQWDQPTQDNDFPDIVGETVSGRHIGVELGEWLNREEMAAAKAKESHEASILEAIGPQGTNRTAHIDHVWLQPTRSVKLADRTAFRDQLLACIQAIDERWPHEPYWQSPAGARLTNENLGAYPLLRKHLAWIKFWPRRPDREWPDPEKWILFRARAGFFDGDTMLTPLKALIAEKTGRYGQSRMGFDHLSLLLYHDIAALYNSPYDTPLHPEETVIDAATEAIGQSIGPFDRVFLYIPGRVYTLR